MFFLKFVISDPLDDFLRLGDLGKCWMIKGWMTGKVSHLYLVSPWKIQVQKNIIMICDDMCTVYVYVFII